MENIIKGISGRPYEKPENTFAWQRLSTTIQRKTPQTSHSGHRASINPTEQDEPQFTTYEK